MAQGSSNPTTDLKKIAGTATDVNTGNATAGTQRVVLASNQPVIPVGDNGASLTVDAPATAPVSVRLSNGTAAVDTLPVSIATLPTLAAGTNNIGDVDVASLPGTVAADITAIKTATELLDNALGTDGAAVATGMLRVGGTDGTNNQTISVTTAGAVNIADGGNSITVDGTVAATQSGTWNIGSITTLPALPAGTNNIGDVDVITLPALPTGSNTIGNVNVNGTVPVSGTFWQATQPVSGTVTATGPLTDTQLRATAVPVSLASVPSHPVTNAGTFAVQVSTALPAGTNNIGDVDVLSIIPGTGATNLGKQTDSAAGATDTGVAVLAIRDDALTTLTPVDGDYTRVRVNSVGRVWTSAAIDTALPAGTNNIGDVDVLSLPALPTGANTIGNVNVNGTVPVSGTFWQATQPVSGSVTVSGTVTATGPLTDTQLRATAVPVSGTVTVGNASIAVTDNAGSLTVDAPVATPVFVRLSDGAAAIAALPITDNGGSLTVDGSVTVSGTVAATQSGTWNIGSITTLPALPAGTNNIGDVDVASLPGTVAADITAIKTGVELLDNAVNVHDAVASTTGLQVSGFASTTAPTAVVAGDSARIWTTLNGAVNIADGGSTISIDDGAGSITVDGTVAATQSGTWNIGSITTLPALPTGANTIGNVNVNGTVPVSGTFWQATQPVSIATLPALAAGTNNIGDVDVLSLPSLPAGTNNIGDVDVLTLPALPTGTNTIGAVYNRPIVSGTTYQPSNATTTAYAASLVVKASAGALFAITGYSSRTTPQFIHVYNSTTLPADGTAPVIVFRIPADGNFSLDLTPYGRYFATGIVVANSTTGPTKTIGAADCWFDVQFL